MRICRRYILPWLFCLCLGSISFPNLARGICPDLLSQLSPQEKSWLDEHGGDLRYAPNPSWPPGDYMEQGLHKGIVSDYIRIFEEKLGLQFHKVYFGGWSEMLEGLKSKKVDFAGAMQRSEEREQYVSFTAPFLVTRLAVIVRAEIADDLSKQDLEALSLAGTEGYTSLDYVKKAYPEAVITETKDDLDALLRVSAGAVDGAVVDYMVASYLIEKYGITNLGFAMELDYQWELSFAVRNGLPEFLSILEKTLQTIDKTQRIEIYRKWVGLELKQTPSFLDRYGKFIISFLVIAISLLLATAVFVLLLKKKVQQRTRELTKAGHDLRETQEYLRAVLDSGGDAIFVHDADTGEILDVNHRMSELYGYSKEKALGSTMGELSQGEPPYSQTDALNHLRQARESGPQTFEWMARHRDGHLFWVETTVRFAVIGERNRFVVFVRDISERKSKAEEHNLLQSMFFEAQKMESVGRLAGGVAHDFNNMLGVILGFAELALSRTRKGDRIQDDLNAVLDAADRAARVTRQLLAFAHKQTIAPKLLDLNESIENMLKMLGRLIGEDIALSFRPAVQKTFVLMDPSQLDQLLINLCVNSRDAISDRGKIDIEIDRVRLGKNHCPEHVELNPGHYAVLTVRDDGCGMDEEARQHIFEPFFTTKGMGKGTGLGLAVVYGIVQQNGGSINVESEVGSGTTFRIFLPQYEETASQNKAQSGEAVRLAQGETVMVIEDESALLDLSRQILESQGYNVLAAPNPSRALALAKEHGTEIRLLITDVVLPEMSGRELAMKLHSLFPGLKVLYMSGYASNLLAHQGVLEKDVQLIHKPFSMQQLAAKVQEALLAASPP